MSFYKGCTVPVRNPGGGVYLAVEIPEQDDFLKYLDCLRRFLELSIRASGVGGSEERLELVADLIALFYKVPLLEEPIRGLSLSPFKAYLTYRVMRHNFRDLDEKSMKDVMESLSDAHREMSDIFELLDRISDLSEDIFIRAPADTRPGYNISSLIVHLLAVSALAWSKGSGLGRRERAILRIASLLHDIGKPLDPEHHVSRSVGEARKLLSGILSIEDLEEVLEIIENHHNPGYSGRFKGEVSILREADHFSAGADRLNSLIWASIIGELAELSGLSEEDAFETYYVRGEWGRWLELERRRPGITRELTEKCVKYALSEYRMEEGEERFEGVHIVKLDVASIQDFIRDSEKLPLLSASSYIVDLAVMFNSLRAVQAEIPGYPVECFLYSAGGNVIALFPREMLDMARKPLRRAFSEEYLGFGPLSVNIADTELIDNYRKMIEELDRRLEVEKISIKQDRGIISLGIEMLCDFCRKGPATMDLRIGEEVFHLCEECEGRYAFFRSRGHMRNKWEEAETLSGKKLREVFGREWNDVSEWILELIAGHDEEPGEERYLNIAVVKLDGNLMGSFMARSINLSDALERSARIDISLKKAFKEAIKAIHDSCGEKEEARVILGLQYIGGDDSLILAPSWLSYPLSLILMVEFARNMGYSLIDECTYTGATLSVGLAAMPPAHNIWAALDAVSVLLSRAKDKGRFPFYMGAIAFDVTEGGLLTGETAGARMRELQKLHLSCQPWIIGPYGDGGCDPFKPFRVPPRAEREVRPERGLDALWALIKVLGGEEIDPLRSPDSELRSLYRELMRRSYEEYERAKRGEETRLKEIRRFIRKVESFPSRFGFSLSDREYSSLARALALYESEDRGLRSLFMNDILEDLNRLCKILMGGAA
ncbi:HD domain-containing protein [Candidatus Korarchaeum cryptofilum]|uniref:HD domain-containing protein n=1 Tax=Candidatus Korarchaeum cryptofilum TaxID=498846 RepID=A0A3R9Q8F0_9CREN|nr:HD domain-containing protein [Candidatus Korarchaeum cryptofilum]RSN67857.1 HD domain-containing protein [Candidatus Korarchaeum cryptofilum]